MRVTAQNLGLWSKIAKALPFSGARKAPIGYDLAGNRYYELPNPNGGNPRRVVEYADSPTSYAYSSPEFYRSGTAQLPVQWTAWMSYTRATPPTMEELERDAARQAALAEKVKLIEAREREERILQGYLLPDGTEVGERKVPTSLGGDGGERPAIEEGRLATEGVTSAADSTQNAGGAPTFASAGGTPHASARYAFPPAPRERVPQKGSAPVSVTARADAEAGAPAEEEMPIAPPRPKVDALSTDSATLRQLAEEDTRRRLRESGVSEEGEGQAGVQGVGRAFRPRRRGQ